MRGPFGHFHADSQPPICIFQFDHHFERCAQRWCAQHIRQFANSKGTAQNVFHQQIEQMGQRAWPIMCSKCSHSVLTQKWATEATQIQKHGRKPEIILKTHDLITVFTFISNQIRKLTENLLVVFERIYFWSTFRSNTSFCYRWKRKCDGGLVHSTRSSVHSTQLAIARRPQNNATHQMSWQIHNDTIRAN